MHKITTANNTFRIKNESISKINMNNGGPMRIVKKLSIPKQDPEKGRTTQRISQR